MVTEHGQTGSAFGGAERRRTLPRSAACL